MDKPTFEEIVKAYKDCKRNKHKSMSKTEFEFNLEENLFSLYEDLTTNNYEIGKSICFVVLEPKIREVWAADFRDRVVHHLVYNRIFNRFEKGFIKDTYSCIPNRGTYYGAKAIEKYCTQITQNYTRNAYFMK